MVKIPPVESAKHKNSRYLVFGINGWKSRAIKEVLKIKDTKLTNNIKIRNLNVTMSVQLG